MEYLVAYLILFTICLFTVARIIPYQIPLVLVLIYMLLRNRENISRVDYSLLATFIALFIFIGNLGRIPHSAVFWKESWQEGKHLLPFLPVRL